MSGHEKSYTNFAQRLWLVTRATRAHVFASYQGTPSRGENLSRPSGTFVGRAQAFPPLKRWAIGGRPSGAESSLGFRGPARPTLPRLYEHFHGCASISKQLAWLLRRRRHLHGPDRRRPHVHGRAVVAVDLPSFGRTEPVALRLISSVIHAPGGAVAFVFQAVAQH
jgi:hypothetical protein